LDEGEGRTTRLTPELQFSVAPRIWSLEDKPLKEEVSRTQTFPSSKRTGPVVGQVEKWETVETRQQPGGGAGFQGCCRKKAVFQRQYHCVNTDTGGICFRSGDGGGKGPALCGVVRDVRGETGEREREFTARETMSKGRGEPCHDGDDAGHRVLTAPDGLGAPRG